jgi:hypothetical protein
MCCFADCFRLFAHINRLRLDDAAHYMPGSEKAAEGLIAAKLGDAIHLEASGKHKAAMTALGEGLHTVPIHGHPLSGGREDNGCPG